MHAKFSESASDTRRVRRHSHASQVAFAFVTYFLCLLATSCFSVVPLLQGKMKLTELMPALVFYCLPLLGPFAELLVREESSVVNCSLWAALLLLLQIHALFVRRTPRSRFVFLACVWVFWGLCFAYDGV